MHRMRALLLATVALFTSPALACDYPDEGNMPLRRAVTRVQMLPETLAWHRERIEAKEAVQYRLLLHHQSNFQGKCYWAVEALSAGELWRRFFVTPDGKRVRRAGAAPAPG